MFSSRRVVVFVDGCFWHGCPEHYSAPATNAEFWAEKLARNAKRDQRVDDQLRELGWAPLRLWEHHVLMDLSGAVAQVQAALDQGAIRAEGEDSPVRRTGPPQPLRADQ